MLASLAQTHEQLLGEQQTARRNGPNGARAHERSSRRERGAFYTPREIAAPLVAAALDALEPLRLAHPPAILDPAAGGGVFLAAALEELYRRLAPRSRTTAGALVARLVRRCLYGVDIDPVAVKMARASVCLTAAELAQQAGEAIDLPALWRATARRIVCADALAGGAELSRFPLRRTRPFDVVLGNPPFVSFSGREGQRIAPEERQRLRSMFSLARGWPSLASLFVELAHGVLREGGALGFVVPAAMFHLPSYEPVRRFLLENFNLKRVAAVEDAAFPAVTATTGALLATKGRGAENGLCTVLGAQVSQESIARRPFCAFWVRKHEEQWQRVEGDPRFVPLGAIAEVRDWGVHTGNVRAKMLRPPSEKHLPPVLRGRDVRAFVIGRPELRLNPSPRLGPREYCSVRPAEVYRRPKVLVRQTANRPIAAVDEQGHYFLNSLLAIYPLCDAHALCALLNSEYVCAYYRDTFADGAQRTFPQVKAAYLKLLPVPAALLDAEDERVRRLAALARAQARAPCSERLGEIEALVRALYAAAD